MCPVSVPWKEDQSCTVLHLSIVGVPEKERGRGNESQQFVPMIKAVTPWRTAV